MDVDEVELTLHIPETPHLYCLGCHRQTTNGALASFRAVMLQSVFIFLLSFRVQRKPKIETGLFTWMLSLGLFI